MEIIYTKEIQTPIGTMTAGATDRGICLFDFNDRHALAAVTGRIAKYVGGDFRPGDHPFLDLLAQQIGAYFSGARKTFEGILLHPAGSPFQQKVWAQLLDIPYGETRTYTQQSIACGDLKAIRAVATANGANGLEIIIPCHRVIAANGALTGYGGGLQRKTWLLAHERKYSNAGETGRLF